MIVAWYAKRGRKNRAYPPAPTLIEVDDNTDTFRIGNPGGVRPAAPVLFEIDDSKNIFKISSNQT